jgi:hypothetical protein
MRERNEITDCIQAVESFVIKGDSSEDEFGPRCCRRWHARRVFEHARLSLRVRHGRTETLTVSFAAANTPSQRTWTGACSGSATTCIVAAAASTTDSVRMTLQRLPQNRRTSSALFPTSRSFPSLAASTAIAADFSAPNTFSVSVAPGASAGSANVNAIAIGPTNGAVLIACTTVGTVGGSATGLCNSAYPSSTKIVLTATPLSGGTFVDWGGACAAALGPTCTLVGAQAVTVNIHP